MIIIALMQSDNRLATSITMGVFATGVAASVALILSYDRPFIGQLSIGPDSLLRVMPEAAAPPVVAAQVAPPAPEAPAAARSRNRRQNRWRTPGEWPRLYFPLKFLLPTLGNKHPWRASKPVSNNITPTPQPIPMAA
jgi:hypothetical protein